MKVAYITYPYFLDTCIERIKYLSTKVDLYAYVIISPYNLKSAIADFKVEYDEKKMLYELDEIATVGDVCKLTPYLNNCKSVRFIMMPPKSLSIRAVKKVSKLKKMLKQLSPDVIHMQEPPLIFWSMTWFLKKYPTVFSIHDPKPHTGEYSWRKSLIKKFLFNSVDTFELYSQYSTKQFIETYKVKANILSTELLPYTIYKTFMPVKVDMPIDFGKDKVILFYGRISKYKGVEFLLESFEKLQRTTKNVKLIIAGKNNNNYELRIPEKCKRLIGQNIFILNRYIQTEEVAFLMENSNILICPYTDATQSGIVMTAIPFGIPVIVSNMGALPEQVQKYNCGDILLEYDTEKLSALMKNTLEKSARRIQINYSAIINETISKIVMGYESLLNENNIKI